MIIVSRQSITEINWDSFSDPSQRDEFQDNPPEYNNPKGEPLELSEYSTFQSLQTGRRSWPQTRRATQRVSFQIGPLGDPVDPLERQVGQPGQRSKSEPNARYAAQGGCYTGIAVAPPPPITSFPRLLSRSCTNDWLTPLGLFEDVNDEESDAHQTTTTDLYSRGVDAHCGPGVYTPLPILEEGSQTASISPTQSPVPDYHSPSPAYSENQWSSHTNESNESHGKRLGQSIGAAAHKRIKARDSYERHQGLGTSLFDGLQNFSLLPTLGQTTEFTRDDRSDKGQKRTSQGLLRRILQQSDLASIKSSRSKSSSVMWENIRRRDQSRSCSEYESLSCPEETRPHVCMDEQERDSDCG